MACRIEIAGVSKEVKQLIREIITKNNSSEGCIVKYYPGSEAGDGYTSKTFAVDITDGEASINIFVKCALNIADKYFSIHEIFNNEIYFYKTIYPTYTSFWKDKCIKDGFQNVPICYGFNEAKGGEVVAFENLKKKGYTLFDRFTFMNDEHLKLVLGSFAKFHALSFAIKDQRKDMHDEFCEHCPNVFTKQEILPKIFSNLTKNFVEKLDPIEDKDILERCDDLHSRVLDQIKNMEDYLTDYSIFTKGDCWLNNMMILYENDDREHPKDVMLIDWQCVLRASPVHDVEALFYSVASKDNVNNYKYYMQIYYGELSKRIEELGSDPEIVYPRSVFEQEWIRYGVYALGFYLALIKVMLYKTEDVPTFEKDMNEEEMENMFTDVLHDEQEYLRRSKHLVRHMISIGIL